MGEKRQSPMGRAYPWEANRIVPAETGSESGGVGLFFSFGEALYGGPYYDYAESLKSVLKPQCLLATHMNGSQPAPAGIRRSAAPPSKNQLRVQNGGGGGSNGLERIEFIASENCFGKVEGGSKREMKRRTSPTFNCGSESADPQHMGADQSCPCLQNRPPAGFGC